MSAANIKPACQIMLVRSELPTLLAAELPSFIFYNPGLVIKTMGQKTCVKWLGHEPFWFDNEALNVIEASCK